MAMQPQVLIKLIKLPTHTEGKWRDIRVWREFSGVLGVFGGRTNNFPAKLTQAVDKLDAGKLSTNAISMWEEYQMQVSIC